MLLVTWKALRTSCQLCPLTFSLTWILAFLLSTGGVLAQDGQFRYCCDIQKCQNVTEVCRSTPGCAQSCLTGPNVSFPASCTPSWILPGQEYSCFSQYMNASVSRVDQICGQTYSPGSEPAPMVLMDYGTCKQICPGWHLSPLSTSTGPVTLLIQYIFPVVVFCIAIPRRRKWEVPDFLFEFGDKRLLRLPRLLASLVVSGIIVTIDMTVWIFTIFVGAGPILVGGITELVLDFEILRYIDHNMSLSANERVELMVTVLCGNLDLEHNAPDTRIKAALRLAEPAALRLAEPAHKLSRADLPTKITNEVKPAAKLTTTPVPDEAASRMEETKTHLISMLDCQGTFGSLVGAPVLFFIGSFVVTLDTLRDHIGDNSTALSLSFGMWWTVITHVTIISSCALASNNPSTVASIVAGADKGHGSQKDGHKDQRRHHADQGPHRFHFGMSRVFEAEFMPVALWDRGIMKKRWLERTTLQPSNNRASPGRKSGCIRPGQPELQPLFRWMLVPLSAFLLILYPTTLAFVISYTTPRICISCR